MAREEGCARHQSCDCVQVEQVLETVETDEALSEARMIACDLRIGGHVIDELGHLFEGYAPVLHGLADDLQDIVAHLDGQRRYRVDIRCGTVFAETEQEAIEKAELADCRTTEHEAEVEHRPLIETTETSPEPREDA